MNAFSQILRRFFTPFFLCLPMLLASQSSQAALDESLITVVNSETSCLTGWIPLNRTNQDNCLKIQNCSRKAPSAPQQHQIPNTQIDTCPVSLLQAAESDPNILAMISNHSGNTTVSEYISGNQASASESWIYGWSTAQLGMTGLHIAKAIEKITLLSSGKSRIPKKDAGFFAVYVIGAIYHAAQMPIVISEDILPHIIQHIAHAGMLIVSIITRFYDCTCCSQYKNGHNTMIAFHVLGMILATLW